MKKRILLFPSAWSTEQVFSPQIACLGESYEVIAPNIHQFNNIRQMSDFVINHYQNAYALIGLSMGGFVVQDILTRVPDFARKAILMGTHAHANSEEVKAFFQSLIDQVRLGKLNELCQPYAEAVLAKESLHNHTLVESVKNFPLTLGEKQCINHHQACMHWDSHEDLLKNVHAEVLILAGEKDAAVPLAAHQKLQSLISNASLMIINGAGHFMTLEEPEQVNEKIIAFLQKEDQKLSK